MCVCVCVSKVGGGGGGGCRFIVWETQGDTHYAGIGKLVFSLVNMKSYFSMKYK